MAGSFKENRHITGRFVEEFRLIIPMHRLFVAIRPPAAIRKALLSIMGGVEGARWQSDDQLHLTLRFIGEVDRHRADDIAAALATVGRSEEHTSELQSLMRISYAVFCLKKKKNNKHHDHIKQQRKQKTNINTSIDNT